ncbi:MAG: phospholipid carrier-dependent glycosyltransferase, partial [Myxococcota bacterium]
EIAARLPSALAGIATVALTLQLGTLLFRQLPAGVWSSLILLTSFLFAHVARRAQLDVLLAFFETLALWAFVRLEGGTGSRRAHLLVLHGALGCAVLTKGPVALLPLAVIATFLAWERRLSEFRRFVPAWGLALSLGPALIWITTASVLAPPGFFGEAVVENLFGRFFEGTSHARPFYYYAIQLPVNFLPWTLLWPLAAVCAYRHLRGSANGESHPAAWRFAIAWLGVFLVFFSLSAGKRGLYLVPAFPAVALLCGAALHEALACRSQLPGWLRHLLAIGLVVLAGAGLFLAWNPALEFAPGFAAPRSFAIALVLVAAPIGWTAWRWAQHPSAGSLHVGLVVGGVFAIEWLLFSVALPVFDLEKSPRPIAERASEITPEGAPIGVYQLRPLVGGIAYYGSRAVVEIPDVASLREFVDHGGGAILLRASHLDSVQREVPVRAVTSRRSGKRRIVIAVAETNSTGDALEDRVNEIVPRRGK